MCHKVISICMCTVSHEWHIYGGGGGGGDVNIKLDHTRFMCLEIYIPYYTYVL